MGWAESRSFGSFGTFEPFFVRYCGTTNDPDYPNDPNYLILGIVAVVELRSLHAHVDGNQRVIVQLSCRDMDMNR